MTYDQEKPLSAKRAVRLIHLPLIGLGVTFIGFLVNLAGWYLVEERAVAIVGLVLCAIGMAIFALGLIRAQVKIIRAWLGLKD